MTIQIVARQFKERMIVKARNSPSAGSATRKSKTETPREMGPAEVTLYFFIIAALLIGAAYVLTTPTFWNIHSAAPVPTRVPFERPTTAPTTVPDVVIPASEPIGLEFPSVGFNTANLVLPAGQADALMKWTEQDNIAHNGTLTPPQPSDTSIVWDSTVPGGGLVGTDAQSSVTIAGHTSPYEDKNGNRLEKLGVFQPLMQVIIGDPAVVVTTNGRVCYNVIDVDTSILKKSKVDTNGDGIKDTSEVDAKYRYAAPVKDVVYIILCDRFDNGDSGPTKYLRVLVLQVDHGAINAGSC